MDNINKKDLIKVWVISIFFIAVSAVLAFIDIISYLAEEKMLEKVDYSVDWDKTGRDNLEVIKTLRNSNEKAFLSDVDYKFLSKLDPENIAVDYLYLSSAIRSLYDSGRVALKDISPSGEEKKTIYKIYDENKLKEITGSYSQLANKKQLNIYNEEYFFEATKSLNFSSQSQQLKLELYQNRIVYIDRGIIHLYLLYPNLTDIDALRKRFQNQIQLSKNLIKNVKTTEQIFIVSYHNFANLVVLLNLEQETQDALKEEIDYFKRASLSIRSLFRKESDIFKKNWEEISYVSRRSLGAAGFDDKGNLEEWLRPSRYMEYTLLDRKINYIPVCVMLVFLLWFSVVLFRKTEAVSYKCPGMKSLIISFILPLVLLILYSLLCNYLPHRQKTIEYAMYGYSYEKVFVFLVVLLVPYYFLMRDLSEDKNFFSKSSKVFLCICLGLPITATFFDLDSLEKPMVDIVAFGCFIGPGCAFILFLLINYVKVIINKDKAVFLKSCLSYVLLLGTYLIFVFVLNGTFLRFLESSYAKKDLFSKIISDDGKAKLFFTDKGVEDFHKSLKNVDVTDFKMKKNLKTMYSLKVMTAEDIKREKSEKEALKQKSTETIRTGRRSRISK